MTVEPMRVVLCDRQTLLREGLRSALTDAGHVVAATTTTRRGLVPVVRECRPDVCLVDAEFPAEDTDISIAELVRLVPGTKVVVLTGSGGAKAVRRAFDAGAVGFVHKSRGLDAVLGALARVQAGLRVTADAMEAPVGRTASSRQPQLSRLAAYLTPREVECLRLLATGLDTATMARRLGVSVPTVRSHVQSVLTKLGAHSRLEAASLAIRYGLVQSGTTSAPSAGPRLEHGHRVGLASTLPATGTSSRVPPELPD